MQNEQQQILMETQQKDGPRRCIVATNVAETSMTIDGVVFVIDSGFCKRKMYNARSKLESLLVQRISRASATQRAGRAGRTQPGKCFRLYTEQCFKETMKEIVPEIKHTNLDSVILRLKKCGIDDIYQFHLIDAPLPDSIRHSIRLLTDLGALDNFGRITPLGEHINILPVDPPLARMMLESVKLRCTKEVICICAMLSAPKCFRRPRRRRIEADNAKVKFTDDRGDHLTLLRVYKAFAAIPTDQKDDKLRKDWCFENYLNYRSLQFADDVQNQLENIMRKRLHVEVVRSDNSPFPLYPFSILKALLAGSFMKLAFFRPASTGLFRRAQKGFYVTVESQMNSEATATGENNHRFLLHYSSVLFQGKTYIPSRPEWVLFNETIQHNEQGQQFLQTVSVVRPEWLAQVAPIYRSQISTASPEVDKLLKEREKGTISGIVEEFSNILQF
ncbi:hypothetical protein niasHT_025323 [Heterodera trifolii]|uniref:Helicase C-terminal domain-containing protein n=1 Tax=Heterodera trifolii TaxID=157864 RepID=A0ABD2KKJ1_9BILA